MFSQFIRSTLAYLIPLHTRTALTTLPEPDRQISVELAGATEEGMVLTRSQEHALPDRGLHKSPTIGSLIVLVEKRKADHDPTPGSCQANSKRRRITTEPDFIEALQPDASFHTPTTLPSISQLPSKPYVSDDQKSANHDISGMNDTSVMPPSTASPDHIKDMFAVSDEEDSASAVRNGSSLVEGNYELQKDHVSSESLCRVQEVPDETLSSLGCSNDRQNGKDSRMELSSLVELAEDIHAIDPLVEVLEKKQVAEPMIESQKAVHKRFGSEELEVPIVPEHGISNGDSTSGAIEQTDTVSEVDVEIEDEAPETVTASVGLDQARAAVSEAAKVAKTQEAADKKKRKERDAQLKLQAKSARKKREALANDSQGKRVDSEEESSVGLNDNGHVGAKVTKWSSKDPLPALLSDDVLTMEPTTRPPTPPRELTASNTLINRKRKFLDSEPKPPKDVKRGPVSVRVLENNRAILPPKASKASKALRESWLTGCRGPNGIAVVRRRKIGGGFVRK